MELRVGDLETMVEESKVMGELDLTLLTKRINSFFKNTPATVEAKSPTMKVWEVYCEEFKKRYGVDPTRNAKVNKQIQLLVGRLGSEAVAVVRFFMNLKDPWYLRNYHDIGMCLSDAEKLRTRMLTGQNVTKLQVRALESEDEVISQLKRIEEGKV